MVSEECDHLALLRRIGTECQRWVDHEGVKDSADALAQGILGLIDDLDEECSCECEEVFDGTAHIILGWGEEELLNTQVKIPKRVLLEWMSQMGFHIEKPRPARLRAMRPPYGGPPIRCEHVSVCIDHVKKCHECDNNKAKSLFKPKASDEKEPQTPQG